MNKKEKVFKQISEELDYIVDNKKNTCGTAELKKAMNDYLQGVELKTVQDKVTFVIFLIAVAFPDANSEEAKALMDRITAVHSLLTALKEGQIPGGPFH